MLYKYTIEDTLSYFKVKWDILKAEREEMLWENFKEENTLKA